MEMDFTKYSVEELRELQNRIGGYLQNREDGFIYICEVRSYGSKWKNTLTNELAVNDLCEDYNGQDGIVNVYTSNPDAKITNYGGDIMLIKSKDEYDKWLLGTEMANEISTAEHRLKIWEERHNMPYGMKPTFPPHYTKDDISEMKKGLKKIGGYEKPIPMNKYFDDYE